jgi:hypothetical protein
VAGGAVVATYFIVKKLRHKEEPASQSAKKSARVDAEQAAHKKTIERAAMRLGPSTLAVQMMENTALRTVSVGE